MQACAIKFWALMLLAIVGISAQAQEVSPYSRYGIGDISSPDFAASRSLGGLSAAYRDKYNINAVNPASYSFIRYATFEIGLNSTTKWLQTTDSKYQTGDAFLDYVAMAFPLGKNQGISFGLVPFSSMRYDLQSSTTDSLGNDYTRLYSGKGRTYDFYLGYSKATIINFRNVLSFGTNVAYRFGQLRYGEVLTLSDGGNSLSARRNSTLRVSDVVVTVGAQYRTCFSCPDTLVTDPIQIEAEQNKKHLYLTVGAYGGSPSNISSNISSTFDRFYISGSSVVTVDTVSSTDDTKMKLRLPAQFGLGATLGDDIKWTVGLDLKYTFWNGFNSLSGGEPLQNSFRFGGGIELCPNISGKGFVRRTRYRLGGYYDSGHLSISNKSIVEYGMTFGLGIPLKPKGKGEERLNIGFAAGSRGTTSNGLLQETFIKVSIGILLNASAGYDNWFKKAKYQ